MSGIDERLKLALRAIRKGDWVYGVKSPYFKQVIYQKIDF